MAGRRRVPGLPALLGLWRGDEDSLGYVHEGLCREICRKLKPGSVFDLFCQLYPEVPRDQFVSALDQDVRDLVKRVFDEWKKEVRR